MAAPAIPGFRVLRPLGSGGMGQVFLVEPEGLPGAVRALKVLTGHGGAERSSVERRERFVREGDLLARLHGAPGIVRVHGAGAHGDLLWLCMEHVDGRDLSIVLQERGPLPWAEATRLVRGVALGLAAAHERGVIHRDVKPANVVLDRAGAGSLVDFGIAQAIDLERLTRTGMTVGTPVYFSPEQATGRPLDGRTDVYSLGVLLFELLTGQLPFADDVPFPALLDAILHEAPRAPSALTAGLPADLDRAVLAALTKAPEQRPDARAWAASLDACLDGEGLDVVASRRAGRRATVGVGVGLVAAGLGALALVALGSRPLAPPPVGAPPPPSAEVSPASAAEAAELAVSQAATAAPESRLAAQARARAALAALPPGAARTLQELRLAWHADTQLGSQLTVGDVLAVLSRVRAVAAVEGTPAAVRTQVRLLEGEVLMGLGWHETAAAVLVRVRAELVAAPPEERRATSTLRLGTAFVIAPADLAARALLARAHACRLDDAAALAAADDVALRAQELDLPEAQVVASTLRAEALALLGRADDARAALADARRLLERVETGRTAPMRAVVDGMAARLARWGLGGELSGLEVDTEVATSYLIEGLAEVQRAAPLDPAAYPTLGPLDARALARGRRALRLAIAGALDPKLEAVTWAQLARSHLLEDDLPRAEEALVRALGATPEPPFEVRRIGALVRGARGERVAVEELRTCLRVIATSSARLPLRGADLLAAGADALRVLKDPRARFAVLDDLWGMAAALRLPPPLRERIGQAALEIARDGPRARLEAVEQGLASLRAEVAALVPEVRAALEARQELMGAPAMGPLITVLARFPLDASLYDTLWSRGAELEPWAFDVMALAFELRPSVGPAHANLTRRRATKPEDRALVKEIVGRHLRSDEAINHDLPVRSDDDLRRAVLVLVAGEAGLELSTETVFAALGASWRALERLPRSPSRWLTLGYARLELGDPGGALVAFERAGALHPAFEPRAQNVWPRFYSALAHGALGDPAAASVALREVVAGGAFRFPERLKDPRLAAVPELDALEFDARANDRRR